jgi:Kef-type K+ transport system membrane component KefB
MGTVISFELLGLHPIIAGFFAGLILSDSINSSVLKDKIRTISYGVFIPTFFIIIGAQTDIGIILGSRETVVLVAMVVFGSILSKLVSGWIGGKMVGFSSDQSLLFAVSSVPQLSTTLAVAFTSLALGFIDQKLITAMVALSIITVIVSPILMNLLGDRIRRSLS